MTLSNDWREIFESDLSVGVRGINNKLGDLIVLMSCDLSEIGTTDEDCVFGSVDVREKVGDSDVVSDGGKALFIYLVIGVEGGGKFSSSMCYWRVGK